MKKIDELIQWYEENSTCKYDDLILADLRLINDLYESLDEFEDALFRDKIMNTFCEIVETQCYKIDSLASEIDYLNYNTSDMHNFVSVHVPQMEGFENDEQLQKAFTHYLTHQVEKPLSSYTINDYCSRIKVLWKTFSDACKKQDLSGNIRVIEEKVSQDNPLLNVYHHMGEISEYISKQIEKDKDNRNLSNARAAFNKFEEFTFYIMR